MKDAETKAVTASDEIAQRIAATGARFAFGIPGGEVMALMDALDRAGLRIVLVKHENAGGFMGEGAYHADGAPAVLFATIGPGLANAANVIANAWQDRVPMIVLTGCVSAVDEQSYTHQVFDHVAFLKPVTKAAIKVAPGCAAAAVDKAVRIATSGRPGPVLLDVPVDVQREAAAASAPPPHRAQAAMAPAGPDADLARDWIGAAKRPLVLAGVDAIRPEAAKAVDDFARAWGAPVLTTYKAKGVRDEADPLALGGAGLSPTADGLLLPLVRRADCVVLAGYDPIEMRVGWRDPFGAEARVIDIGAAANDHHMHQADLNFTGDLTASLAALTPDAPADATDWAAEATALKGELRRALQAGADWGPAAVVDEARRACPPGTVATADSGAHRITASQVWTCGGPGELLQSSALCTMGCAVPLAIGRKLAEPDRPVVAFVGDAGLEMGLGELATARDLGLSIPIVVFVDGQLGLIELKQRGAGYSNLGVEFPGTDFTAVAKALGGHGETVTDRAGLNAALRAAHDRPGFTLISAMIGRNAYDGRL